MTYTGTPDNRCDFARYNDNPCERKPTFQVENRDHDTYRFCQEHMTWALVLMAESAPLTVQPVFANWPPYSLALASAEAAAQFSLASAST